MSKLVMMCGVPGSGKSHFTREYKSKVGKHVYVVSSDQIRELILGTPQDFSEDKLCWNIFYNLAKTYSIDSKGTVILDATNLTSFLRTVKTKKLKQLFDYRCLVVFDLDKEVIKKQNLNRKWPVPESVLERMFLKYEEPGDMDKEYFNDIFIVKDHNIENVVLDIIKK